MSILIVLFILVVLYVALGGGLKNLARSRKYKSGTGFCIWRWTDVDSEYILRLHVVKTPWFAVCLHWIQKPDAEPWLHDHPVSFLSIILRGWYTEVRKHGDGAPVHKVNRWFNFVRASRADKHRIILVRRDTLTLCFMGPKTREWGFHVWSEIQPGSWIMWKDYYRRLRAGEDMRRRNALRDFEHLVTHVYTERRVARLAGAPAGAVEDESLREIDIRDAEDFVAEAPTDPYESFEISHEDFYKKVKL